MNILDLIIIIIIVTTAIRAYHKGVMYTVFQTVSNLLVLVLSHFAYKPINAILHKVGLYKLLTKMTTSMLFEENGPLGLYEQTQWIESLKLPIPEIIKEGIIKNNNPEIYKLLGVQNLKEYIAGYVADFCLGIISFIIACIVIKIGLHVVELQTTIRTGTTFLRFAYGHPFASLCSSHCSTCVAQNIRGMMI